MAREVINPTRDENVFVNMERRRDPLCKHSGNIIIRVSAVIEFSAERALPFLRGYIAAGVRRVLHKAFELQLPDAVDLRPGLKRKIAIGFIDVRQLNESDFGIKEIGRASCRERV